MARFIYSKIARISQDPKHPELNFKYHPLISISLLSTTRQQVNLKEVYIDTGVQFCLFNSEIALKLGIQDFKLSDCIVPLSGIGGKKPENIAYFHRVKIIVYKDAKNFTLENAWKIDTRIGFLEKPIGFTGVLGVYGFLDQFTFKTNIPEGYFEIEPIFEI